MYLKIYNNNNHNNFNINQRVGFTRLKSKSITQHIHKQIYMSWIRFNSNSKKIHPKLIKSNQVYKLFIL